MMIFESPGPGGEFVLKDEFKAFENWRDTGNSEGFIAECQNAMRKWLCREILEKLGEKGSTKSDRFKKFLRLLVPVIYSVCNCELDISDYPKFIKSDLFDNIFITDGNKTRYKIGKPRDWKDILKEEINSVQPSLIIVSGSLALNVLKETGLMDIPDKKIKEIHLTVFKKYINEKLVYIIPIVHLMGQGYRRKQYHEKMEELHKYFYKESPKSCKKRYKELQIKILTQIVKEEKYNTEKNYFKEKLQDLKE